MALSAGAKLGPYEIVSALGAGGMGEVYRARDTRLERTVAIKVLSSALVASADLKARFEREARTVSQLNHPNICVLHDVGHEGDVDFLVMEFLDGESLAERIRNKGALPLADLIKIGCEIADALDRAHRAGIVHRDLKPGNIMLTKTGAKLLDFGLAKPATMGAVAGSGSAPLLSAAMTMTSPNPQHSPLTQQGSLVGTVQYMSPEQIQGIEADARSDIFALGAVLYEMATGRRAFEGKSQIKVASAILEDEPQQVSAVTRTAPAALDRLVRTCLAKNPDERFQSALDVKLELQWLADSPREALPIEATAAAPSRRAQIAWIATVALLAFAVTTAAYLAYELAQPKAVYRATLLPPEKASFVTSLTVSAPPAISPDGMKVVFAARDEKGQVQLYVRSLSSLTAQPLNGTQNATFPFWSPDSRSIAFFGDGKLKRMDATGGPAQSLADAAGARGGTWSSDGTIVFAPSTSGVLMRVPAGGGTAVPASQIAAHESGHRWPWFLPDGKHFLFWTQAAQSQIAVGTLGSTEHKLLFPNATNASYANGYLLYVRDQMLVAQPFNLRTLATAGDVVPVAEHVDVNTNVFLGVFSASANGALVYQSGQSAGGWPLTWIARDGKHGVELGEAARYAWPAISPDGKRVAVGITESGNTDIWVYDLARGTKTRLTFDPATDRMPCWTPDGTHIIFDSDRKGHFGIYRKAADNSGAEEPIFFDDGDTAWLSISGDGRWLAFMHQGDKTGWDIWGLQLDGDRKGIPVVQTPFTEVEPALSPDGKWLAYSSNESGRFEVYITAFPGGGPKWQVSTNGAGTSHWRGDGKELYFVAANRQMMAVDVTSGASSVTLGTPHALFPVDAQDGPIGPYDVSRDGKKFLINTVSGQEANNPLTLVLNWPAELRK